MVGALPALFGGGGGKAAPQALPTGGAKDAIARRMESMQSDTLKQLEDSAMALAEAPHDIRKEYAAPILTAFEMEAKRRGGVA